MTEDMEVSVQETLQQASATNGPRRIQRWVLAILILLLAGAAFTFYKVRAQGPVVGFQTRPVQKGNLEITVTATGNLEATNQVEVGSELSGIITSVAADFNDLVRRGQPLAYLDDTKIQAVVLKSKAEVSSAKAKYHEALATQRISEKILQRYRKTRKLTNGKLPSLENLEQAEADLERSIAAIAATKAAIESAEATLTSNQTDLKKTVIYSPINGVVLKRNVEQGQTVAASLQAPVLFTLAEDLSKMELQVDVDEADVGQVQQGQTARFSVDAYPDQTFEAEITQVRFGAETTDGVVTYKTVLKVDNQNLLLRPGMTATADIIVRRIENSLLVPNSALRFHPNLQKSTKKKKKQSLMSSLMPRRRANRNKVDRQDKEQDKTTTIWILEKHGHAVAIPVDKIASDGVLTAVRSPELHEGMQIITNETTVTHSSR